MNCAQVIARTICFLIVSFVILYSQAQFQQLTISNNNNTQALHYGSNGVVWVAGDGYTWRSDDHGDDFYGTQALDFDFWGGTLWGQTYGILGLSYSTALMTGNFFLGNDAMIYRSTSTYGQWELSYFDELNLMPPRNTWDITSNGSRIIAVGAQGRILVSDNGGTSFVLIGAPVSTTLQDIEFVGSNTWMACSATHVFRSTDNGNTWTSITPPPGGGMTRVSAAGGVVYAWRQFACYRSVDFGTTWTALPVPPFSIRSIKALTADKVLAPGLTDLYVSYNGGQHWESYQLDNYEEITTMSFYDADHGICASNFGYLVRTANGGGPSYPVAMLDGPESVCTDSLVQYTNSYPGNNTYQWEVNGQVVGAGSSLTYAFPEPGTYELKLKAFNENGSGEDMVEVEVLDVPAVSVPQISLSQEQVCPGGTFTLTIAGSQSGVSYQAFNGNTQVGSILTGNGNNLTVNMTAPSGNGGGSIWQPLSVVASRTNGCTTTVITSLDSILVVRPSVSTYVYAPIDTVCTNTPVVITAANTEIGFEYRWHLGGNSFTTYQPGNGGELEHVFSSLSQGTNTYNLRVRHQAQGCTYGSQNFGTVVLQAINATAGFTVSSTSVAVGQEVSITNLSNTTHHNWTMGDGASYPAFSGDNPPPVSYSFSRRDTIVIHAQMDEQNSCSRVNYKIIDVYGENTWPPSPVCSELLRTGNSMDDIEILADHSTWAVGVVWIDGLQKLNLKKLDGAGNILHDFVQPASGPSHLVSVTGLEVDEEGNILIAYTANGTSSMMWDTLVEGVGILLKISPEGNLLWAVTSNTASSTGIGVIGTDVVMGGHFSGDVIFRQSDGQLHTNAMNSTSPFGGRGWVMTVNAEGMVSHAGRYGKNGSNMLTLYDSEALVFRRGNNGEVWIAGTMDAKTSLASHYRMGPVIFETLHFSTINGSRMIYILRYIPGEGIAKVISPMSFYNIQGIGALLELPDGSLVISASGAYSMENSDGLDFLHYYQSSNPEDNGRLTVTQRLTQQGATIWRLIDRDVMPLALETDGERIHALSITRNNGVFGSGAGAFYSMPATGTSDVALVSYSLDGALTGMQAFSGAAADIPQAMRVDACGNARIAWLEGASGVTFPYAGQLSASSVLHFQRVALSGSCTGECSQPVAPELRDVMVSDLVLDDVSPTGPAQRNLRVALGNFGNVEVEEVVFRLQLNHDEPITITHTGPWAPGTVTADFDLASVVLDPQPGQQMKVWIESVNGQPDHNAANDTVRVSCIWCQGALAGSYSVSAQEGMFGSIHDAYRAAFYCGVSAPVEFLIEDGIYREAINMDPIPGASAENRVVFRSQSGDPYSVRLEPPLGTTSGALLTLDYETSYVTIQDITIARAGTFNPGGLVMVRALANFNHFHGCRFEGVPMISSQCLLQTTTNVAGMEVVDNVFECGAVGFSYGLLDLTYFGIAQGLLVEGNVFNNQTRKNMEISRVSEFIVRNNDFLGWSPSNGAFHVFLSEGNSEFSNNRSLQTRNPVFVSYQGGSAGMNSSNPVALFCFDRFSQNSDAFTLVVSNNYCNSLDFATSLRRVLVTSSKNVKVIHNTFLASLKISTSTNIEVYNNFLGYPGGSPGGFMTEVDLNPYSIDYNQYHSNGDELYWTINNSNHSYSSWLAATSYDDHSVIDELSQTESMDGHLIAQPNKGLASAVVWSPLDYDGEPRNALEPSIGMDEPPAGFVAYSTQVIQPDCATSTGSALIAALGGTEPYSFSWSDGYTEAARDSLVPGSYTITCTDGSGATALCELVIEEPEPLYMNLSVAHSCQGTATISWGTNLPAVSPYTTLWNTGATFSNLVVSTPGTYSVTRTNGMGCTVSGEIEVGTLGFSVQEVNVVPTSCNPLGAVSVTLQSNSEVLYTTWNCGEYSTEDISEVPPGTYLLVAINANGCSLSHTVTLHPQIEVEIENLTGCFDGGNGHLQAVVSGGGPSTQLSWSTGSSDAELTGLGAGVYTVCATDNGQCEVCATVEISGITACGCPGDVDGNGVITTNDMIEVLANFACLSGCTGDANGNGFVGVDDVLLVLSLLGTPCE